MLQEIVSSIHCIMLTESFLQRTITLTIFNYFSKVKVHKGILFGIISKHIVLHIVFILSGLAFSSHTNKCIKNILLLFIHRVNNILNGFIFTVSMFDFFCHLFFFLFVVFRIIFNFIVFKIIFDFIILFICLFFLLILFRMEKFQSRKFRHNCFFLVVIIMDKNCINLSTRICASKNKTYFTNSTMNNIYTILLKLVCIDRERINISIFNCSLSMLTFRSIVAFSVTINTICTILKITMPKNIQRRHMIVLIHKRNSSAITIFKCILSNNSTIRTSHIITSNVTTKIVIVSHLLPPLHNRIKIHLYQLHFDCHKH